LSTTKAKSQKAVSAAAKDVKADLDKAVKEAQDYAKTEMERVQSDMKASIAAALQESKGRLACVEEKAANDLSKIEKQNKVVEEMKQQALNDGRKALQETRQMARDILQDAENQASVLFEEEPDSSKASTG